jgi:hypothetical protein
MPCPVPLLQREATSFAKVESKHAEPSLFGVTDGKAVGTYSEHKFQTVLQPTFRSSGGCEWGIGRASRCGKILGMNSSNSFVLHPAGESVFTFPTYGGNVRLCATDDALTPFGGLGPWAAFQKPCGLLEALAAPCPVAGTSPTNAAPVYDVLTSFGLTVLCDGRRFVHVQRLRADPTLNELFGLERVVSDDTLRRLLVRPASMFLCLKAFIG